MDIKFGTGGFRGVIGDDFIKENIKKIAQAICNLANENNLKKEIMDIQQVQQALMKLKKNLNII